jgi:hypothetical protein
MNQFEKYSGSIYDFSITSKMRGTWFKMLVDSSLADESTKEEKIFFCKQIRRLREYFQCSDCAKHFGEYLLSHPPETEILKNDGLFTWVVNFMNSVSNRLGKELYELDIIYPMFHTPGIMVCTDTCQDHNKKIINDIIIPISLSNRRRNENNLITYSSDKINRPNFFFS